MNYLAQILGFNDKLQFNPLSSGQISLWYALMYINNKCAWIEWFTASNRTLETYTGLSRGGIEKARNVLKQSGFIDFQSNGKKATSYKITVLTSNSIQGSIQEGSIKEALKEQDSIQGSMQNSRTLNKHKLKHKHIYSASDDTQNNSATQKKPSTKTYEVFEKIWDLYPEKKGKNQVSKKSKEQMEKLGIEKMEKALQRYIDDVNKQRKQGFNSLRYKNGSTWFNSGYEDYLVDNNVAEVKKEPAKIVYVNRGYL